jgi:hypothetical protein
MVGKNNIIGDLEILNDIIYDIIQYIILIIGSQNYISFFPSNLAGKWSHIGKRPPVARKLRAISL